jgi:hypothetical protein
MSTQSDLVTYLQSRAAELTFELDKIECLDLISRWNSIRTAVAALESNEVHSYSIAGRSVQRKDLPSLQSQAEEVYSTIKALLYGGSVTLVDHREFSGTILS